MKKLIAICAMLTFIVSVFAQSPEKMSYQAVVRDGSNNLVSASSVGMQISILQGSSSGTAVYAETHMPMTNANGLVSLEIGGGTVITGDFSAIDWAMGPYFIKTETDPTGGTNYTITGISQLLSVPFSLHAKTASSISGGITETDPVFSTSVASSITSGDTTNWNNKLSSYDETDPVFVASVASSISSADTSNWNNKLSSYTETDPEFTASVASGITGADTSKWNNKLDRIIAGSNITLNGDTISTASNWEAKGTTVYNSTSTAIGVGFSKPLHTFVVGKADSTAELAIGYVGSFNNEKSGKLIFSEDVAYSGGNCGFVFDHNGASNNLFLTSGCPMIIDTLMRFNRNGYSNINKIHIGKNMLQNALNPLSVTGNADFNGTVTINGNLSVTGNIAKGGGTFKIDHPLDPANKYLVHSFVESPEMMNIYSGNIITDEKGYARVELPAYFEAANKDFRYQLTVIGTFAQAIVKEKIKNNTFLILTNEPNVEVSWSVTGIRSDKYANANRVVDVVEKEQKGTYIHPELFGVSKANSEAAVNEDNSKRQGKIKSLDNQ